jgi:hypothetical protein
MNPEEVSGEGEVVLPVIREEWQIHKELRDTGTVRVVKTQVEREETVRDQLLVESAEVERLVVNRVVTEVPPVRVENGVTIIPVVREFAVVVKELRVVEEIHIRQRVSGVPFEQPVVLQEEAVTVERTLGETAPTATGEAANVLEFRERAETATVSKEARVIEEVRVSKVTGERTEVVRDVLRSTDVEVDALPVKPGHSITP